MPDGYLSLAKRFNRLRVRISSDSMAYMMAGARFDSTQFSGLTQLII